MGFDDDALSSITLPTEMAGLGKAKVTCGEYATESKVIWDGLRVLMARAAPWRTGFKTRLVPLTMPSNPTLRERSRWIKCTQDSQLNTISPLLKRDALPVRLQGITFFTAGDVSFREDASRIRKDEGPANLACLRRIALTQLKREKSLKIGIKNKRSRAGWNSAYMAKVLACGALSI